MGLNRIIAIGRLTKKPELRTTPNGVAVSTFTIAVDRNFGENRETEFISVWEIKKFRSNVLMWKIHRNSMFLPALPMLHIRLLLLDHLF